MSNPTYPVTRATEVASEVLTDSVQSQGCCPKCGLASRKSFYADGDTDTCPDCGTEFWFELVGGEVRSHQVRQQSQGISLSEVLRQRESRLAAKAGSKKLS